MKKLLLFPILLLFLSLAQAESYYCKVNDVIDGNNLICQKDHSNNIKIKICQTEAPELTQPFGEEAKNFLTEWLLNKEVYIQTYKETGNQTVYANVILEGKVSIDISIALLEMGLAWNSPFCHRDEFDSEQTPIHLYDQPKIFKNSFYHRKESQAKEKKLGLWSTSNPTPPWKWRKQK
ncbi:thermonuclease family protein [Neisseria sp. Ec49-e6-T10]|uniref:thermonuclease family protein n=1 Tax=Neisseria sp. Ec49-e6-T10 TaxID=3140744 RepID=UPI003EBCCCAA